jgi:hypothetical protein
VIRIGEQARHVWILRVGAVVRVDDHRVVAVERVRPETVGGVGEADRRRREVVVELVDEVERLHAVLLAVVVTRRRIRRIPRAVRGQADRRRPARLREPGIHVRDLARVDLTRRRVEILERVVEIGIAVDP